MISHFLGNENKVKRHSSKGSLTHRSSGSSKYIKLKDPIDNSDIVFRRSMFLG